MQRCCTMAALGQVQLYQLDMVRPVLCAENRARR
jgi:hypothetical protein